MDDFTQKLLERTRARRENLARKVKDLEEIRSGNTRRKRPLREDDINDNRERNFSGVRLDTAKRRCINTREKIERFNKVGINETVKSGAIVNGKDSGSNNENGSQQKENVAQSIRARKAMLFQQQKQQQDEMERQRNEKHLELSSRLERSKIIKASAGTTQDESQISTENSHIAQAPEVKKYNHNSDDKEGFTDQKSSQKAVPERIAVVETPRGEVKEEVHPTVTTDSPEVAEDDSSMSSLSGSEERPSQQLRSNTSDKKISPVNAIARNNVVQPNPDEYKSTMTKNTPVESETSPGYHPSLKSKESQSNVLTPFDLCMGLVSPPSETPKAAENGDQSRRKLPRHPPVPPKRSSQNHSEQITPHSYKNNTNNPPSEKPKSRNSTPQQRRPSNDNNPRSLPPTAPRRKNDLEPTIRSQDRLNLPTPDTSNRASTGIFCGNFMQQKFNRMAGESLKEFSDNKSDNNQEDMRIILEEAATQQAIQFQASNALEICNPGSIEEAEAEKALLLAATRHQACLDQVQRLKGENNLSMTESILHNHSEFKPVNTDISLSDIRIPFNKEFLTEVNDNIVHSFMVLVRDNELTTLSSNLYSTRDGLQKEMNFTNDINLKNVNRNVCLKVEIYHLRQCGGDNPSTSGNTSGNKLTTPKMKKQNLFPKPSPKTPKKFMNMLTGRSQGKGNASQSVSNTPKTAGVPQHANLKKTKFQLIAVAKIDRHTLRNNTYELEQIVQPSPLSSYIQVTTKCNPMSVIEHRGFLNVHDDIGGYNVETWRRRWCKITPYTLSFWNYPEDEEKDQVPISKLDLRYSVSESVHVLPREECFRRHTFQLEMHYLRPVNKSGQVKVQYLLSADCKEERAEWTTAINQLLTDIHGWQLGRIPSNRKEPSYCNV